MDSCILARALCCPLCTLKCFSVICLLWELRFKSLTNMFVREEVEMASDDVALSGAVTCCPGSFYIALWDLTVSPHRSGVPRTQAADPLPSQKENPHMAPSQTITCNRRVIFYTKRSIECVCCFQEPIFGFRRLN